MNVHALKSPQIRCFTQFVTPDIARDWLSRRKNLGRIHERSVESYRMDMANGDWKLNGAAIIHSDRGTLLDGRARLEACIRANVGFPTLVITDVDESHYETIDALRKRTIGDVLTIRKEPNGRALASALTLIWRYWNDDIQRQTKKASVKSILSILELHPEVRDSLLATRDVHPLIPLGCATALHYLMSRVDRQKADEFFQNIVDGVEGVRFDPANVLRRTLNDQLESGGRRLQPHIIALVIKAWEAARAGKEVRLLRFDPEREGFPRISGLSDKEGLDDLNRRKRQPLQAVSADTRGNAEPALSAEIMTITPEIATELLENNAGNRGMASGVIDKYARDISSGNWALNGQTIKIGKSGRLLDGQHRCAAAIKANCSFEAIVVRDVDDEVFDTFDLGSRRSFAEILHDAGETNTATLAAALRIVWLVENQLVQSRTVAPTNAELLQVLEKHHGIRRSVSLAYKLRNVMATGMGVALHYLFHTRDADRADEFIDRLSDGVDLKRSNPILQLRERLIKDRTSRARRLPDAEKMALMIKAWNALREDRPVLQLSWRNKGPNREQFPQIV